VILATGPPGVKTTGRTVAAPPPADYSGRHLARPDHEEHA
jgi:hypothetical protein